MIITVSSIRCGIQIALLGAVTDNLRAVIVTVEENRLTLYFYYEHEPSEEEEENSEVIATEVSSYYIQDTSIEVNRITLPISEKIPDFGICVFHRCEQTTNSLSLTS